MSSTPSAQPRRTHGPQGLRVELTGRVTKWCLLSADCNVQSSPWSCEDHSRGMAGLYPEDSGMPERKTGTQYALVLTASGDREAML